MIGDRYLTDIVYGNRHGMLTIRPSPLTAEGENLSVRWVSVFALRHLNSVQATGSGLAYISYTIQFPQLLTRSA